MPKIVSLLPRALAVLAVLSVMESAASAQQPPPVRIRAPSRPSTVLRSRSRRAKAPI